tara:strand:- start:2345 stop:3931 length:1587 start_codon:yes stop_codon:yes gene_type:complete
MKKFLLILVSTIAIISCSESKVSTLEIPITSSSEDAIDLFSKSVFHPKEAYRTYNPVIDAALKKCVELDPNFSLAQALIGSAGYRITPEERRKKIIAAYENIENVTEIEAAIINSIYENIINGNVSKGEAVLEDAARKYPDYYYLRIYLGEYQNIEAKNPKKSQVSWEEALKIDPDNSLAKLLLSQLHYTTTTDFQLLSRDEIDMEKAIGLIQEVEKAEPDNYICPRLLGNVYRRRGDFDESIKAYEKAMLLIGDEKSSAYGQLLLVNAHNYVFKKEYETARELYGKSIDILRNRGSQNIFTSLWSAETYIYNKKYDQAIRAFDKVEDWVNSNNELSDLQKSNQLYYCDFEKYLAYGHSQMKSDAYQSLQNMNSHADDSKKYRKQLANSDNEIERIDLEVEINKEFNNIWYLILFGEFEDAAEQLKSYSQLSSSYLVYDSKAMINFYKLSGYLNLMSGNVDASLSFYNQIPRELLDGDNYHLYFYALAVNAKGDKEKSVEIFEYLANYNFAGWENSVVRSLAEAQLQG